ncbi:MAG: TMEM165/GDT1 family protein [Candidatus Limnocylindrales bacterium]
MESLLASLGLVFVAELGDKTQLVALSFGARHRVGPVLAGVAIAYAVSNLLSVVVGGLLGVALPVRAIGLIGGVLFLGFAAWTLWGRGVATGDDTNPDGEGAVAIDHRSIVLSVAAAMFVAELGDKTMLATATLAAQGSPVHTWVGATVGIILSGALGVLLGRVFGARLPERVTRLGSAALFALFGAVLLVANL